MKFHRFWVIFDYILGHFAWTIAHPFDPFWAIFTPFKLFLSRKKFHFWSFLAFLHGL
jgi:hypothetical protein